VQGGFGMGFKVDDSEEGAGGLGLGEYIYWYGGRRVLFEAGNAGLLWMMVRPEAFMPDGCDGLRFTVPPPESV
jgi:hypothetical protein